MRQNGNEKISGVWTRRKREHLRRFCKKTTLNVVPADYVGVISANSLPDKLKNTGWHIIRSEFVNAPIIEELPLVLECKLVSYDTDTEICIGEVVNVSVDEGILDENGKIDLTKFEPICYDCCGHGYFKLGEKVGNAFADGLKLK